MKNTFALLLILSSLVGTKTFAAAHQNFFTAVTAAEEEASTNTENITTAWTEVSEAQWEEFSKFKQNVYDALLNRFFEPGTRRLADNVLDFRVTTDIYNEHLMVSKKFEAILAEAFFGSELNTTSDSSKPEMSWVLQEIAVLLNFTPDENSLNSIRGMMKEVLSTQLTVKCRAVL